MDKMFCNFFSKSDHRNKLIIQAWKHTPTRNFYAVDLFVSLTSYHFLKMFLLVMFGRVSKPMQKQSPRSFPLMGARKNFARFAGKYLYQTLFLSRNFIKKRLWLRCFPLNFAKLLSAPFCKYCRWLLLPMADLPIASPVDNFLLLLAGCIFFKDHCISWHSKNFN